MSRFYFLFAIFAFAVALLSGIEPAAAQATRTWVSGVGDDANPCSRTAPCKTFAGAISKTAAGGEINCIDNGAYGAVTITKAMTIACEDNEAGVLASGTNGIIVNAGANDVVVLRGLDINGGTAVGPGLNGVRFLAGAALHIEDCVIYNFVAGTPNGNGIVFMPSTGVSELYIHNSQVHKNGVTGAGVAINPSGDASVNAVITNSSFDNNNIGIRARNNTSTGNVNLAVSNSSISGNTALGLLAEAGASGAVGVGVIRSVISNNGTIGVRAISPAVLRLGDSIVMGNATGVNGNVRSYGNNQLDGNGVQGAPTPISPASGLGP